MCEEPEEMLPEERTAATADVSGLAADEQAGREIEAGMENFVHELHDGSGFERREGQQKKEAGDELRPDEKGQAHPGEAGGAQLDDRGQEVDGAEQRQSDEEH